jgi:hypothetical protein
MTTPLIAHKCTSSVRDYSVAVDPNRHPDILFVFETSIMKRPRNLPLNLIGIPTIIARTGDNIIYMEETDVCCDAVVEALFYLGDMASRYHHVVFPKKGFGNTYADLKTCAPSIYRSIHNIFIDDFKVEAYTKFIRLIDD